MAMARQIKRVRLAGACGVMGVLAGALWATGCSSSNNDTRQSCGADGVCNPDCPTGTFADPDCNGNTGGSTGGSGGSTSGGSGGTPSGGGTTGGGECPVTDATDACEVCSMDRCCDEFLACQDSTDCVAVLSCANGCTSDSCVAECVSAHPSGALIVLDMYDCMDASCASDCGL